eukprot:14153699-Ditylum_brightwellii.AAC.1
MAISGKIDKLKNELYLTKRSTAYKINRDLSATGVERAAYFGKALISPHVCQLLSKQQEITDDLKTYLLEVWQESIEKGQTGVATEEE